MAKKRKRDKEEEEEYEFRPPEFNEKEFIEKELRDSKAVIITVIYALGFAVIAGLISGASHDLVGVSFVVVIAGILSLKWVYGLFGIDTKTFQKRNWAGNIGTFFFTFLAIWILLMNTPFADFSNPVVNRVVVWVDDGTSVRGLEYTFDKTTNVYTWEQVNKTFPATIISGSNQTINITAKVADNGKLRSVEIVIGSYSTGGLVNMTRSTLDDRYEHKVTESAIDALPYFFIVASDSAGNSVTFQNAVPLPITQITG